MHRAKVFNKVTKKGTVLKIVKEHYLRDDVVCGSKVLRRPPVGPAHPPSLPARPTAAAHGGVGAHPQACTACPTTATAAVLDASPAVWTGPPTKPHYLVPDTNVFINQVRQDAQAAALRGSDQRP